MSRFTPLPRAIFFTTLAAVFSFGIFAAPVIAQDNSYTIQQAFIRATPSKTTAGYMVVQNTTDQDDALVAANADWAERIELHNVKKNDQGIMKMFQVESMPLPAQGELTLRPGNFHLMIFGVKETLNEGDNKTVTLQFKNGATITQAFTVMPISYMGDDMKHHHNHAAQHDDHMHHGH